MYLGLINMHRHLVMPFRRKQQTVRIFTAIMPQTPQNAQRISSDWHSPQSGWIDTQARAHPHVKYTWFRRNHKITAGNAEQSQRITQAGIKAVAHNAAYMQLIAACDPRLLIRNTCVYISQKKQPAALIISSPLEQRAGSLASFKEPVCCQRSISGVTLVCLWYFLKCIQLSSRHLSTSNSFLLPVCLLLSQNWLGWRSYKITTLFARGLGVCFSRWWIGRVAAPVLECNILLFFFFFFPRLHSRLLSWNGTAHRSRG